MHIPSRRSVLWASLIISVAGCRAALQLEVSDHQTVLAEQLLSGPSPSSRGRYGVRTLTYGHGDDKNRAEYRDAVAFRTETVDASRLISLGDQADSRNGYWGFTPTEFPLNGRVWHPDGDGPFPLVLVVHGNHNPQDFSDPGYDYTRGAAGQPRVYPGVHRHEFREWRDPRRERF